MFYKLNGEKKDPPLCKSWRNLAGPVVFFKIMSRFPGFSKSGPELFLLCKQAAKGKEKISIYVSYIPIYNLLFFVFKI